MQVRCSRCEEFECVCGDPAVEQWIAERNEERELREQEAREEMYERGVGPAWED